MEKSAGTGAALAEAGTAAVGSKVESEYTAAACNDLASDLASASSPNGALRSAPSKAVSACCVAMAQAWSPSGAGGATGWTAFPPVMGATEVRT